MEKTKLVMSVFLSFTVKGCPPLRSLNINTDKIVPAKTEMTMRVTLLRLLIMRMSF